MAPIVASQPPPEEPQDLQELYNQVLAGFSSDSPISLENPHSLGDRDLESIYSNYSQDPLPPTYDTSQHESAPPTGQDNSPSPSSMRSPGASRRPLPRPPQAGGSSSSIDVKLSMPEPQPSGKSDYSNLSSSMPPRPVHKSSESQITSPVGQHVELPRRQSANSNGAPRRLPPAPDPRQVANAADGQTFSGKPTRPSTAEAHRPFGLPSDPRANISMMRTNLNGRPGSSPSPTTSISSGSFAGSSTTRLSALPPYASQAPITEEVPRPPDSSGWSSTLSPNGYGDGLTRSNSNRPKGALAPSIPGHSITFNATQDRPPAPLTNFPGDNYSSSSTENYTRMPEAYQPDVRASSDDLRGAMISGFAKSSLGMRDCSTESVALGRTTSNASATSSFQSPQADLTSSSSSSALYTNGDTVVTTASSATTVNRVNSSSSYISAGSTSSSGKIGDNRFDYRQPSITVSGSPSTSRYTGYDFAESSTNTRMDRVNEFHRTIMALKGPLALHEDDDLDYDDEYEEDDENRFVNLALLSHIAVRLRDKVPRGTHVKGGIPYPRAFTGKDIVSTIQAQIQRELLLNLGISTTNRRPALQVARSLQSQLFFYEVEWGGRVLQDGVEDVYMFLDDQEGGTDSRLEREELPTGVFTMLTKCYSPGCADGVACYAYACPRRKEMDISRSVSVLSTNEVPKEPKNKDWAEFLDKDVLRSLPETEIKRQTIIHKAISKEEQYVQDLDIVESLFMKPLRTANPPVIAADELDSFMDEVFGNILDLRECNRRLVEVMAVRQREQSPIIQRIGDVFLTAAAEFRLAYPIYVGNLPVAEKRLKDEIERNADLRLFLEQCSRHPESRRFDLKHFLTRPSDHLQKYPLLLEAIFNETLEENPDADFLLEAIQAIRKLSTVAQLRTFQSAMGKGPTGKLEWHDIVPAEVRATISKQEGKRQSMIFELIKGEMAYVKDLENIDTMYIRPLKSANPPIIARDKLSAFLHDVFYNHAELHDHHRRLLDRLHEIQREEHPLIRSITAPLLDAALNWRDAYMEYVPHYPISWYRIDEETANNLAFKTFAEQSVRHPDARKLDMKTFVNRPIPRLLRYSLLLKGIMAEAPANHDDRQTIPQVIEVLDSLSKETQPGVRAAEERVEIWRYNENLVFKPGEAIDMDLLDENRSLVHTGKLLRQPDTGFEWNGWTELFVLLFDNYLVMTKPKEKDGVTKYHVNRRPIPLDLLTIVNFTDPPQQRGKGLLGGLRGGERGGERHNEQANTPPGGAATNSEPTDARAIFPCTIHHNGRLGGVWTLYTESAQARAEWKQKLGEATLLRKVVTDANKVFEIETLSSDTFLVPSMHANATNPSWNDENTFTGKVTCSVPFSTADGRGLVAIGCAEGVWIGLRHDPRSMRRVLHLKMVTQCAMLEDFGIFLVLADKALFAYHIEALVPSTPPSANATRTPQKLNGNKDVQFFTVGTLTGRTLIIYMKKKGLDSVFRVLEPVIGKITEKTKAPGGLSRFGFGSQRSEWFRVYRDFFLPSESYDLVFLKAKIAILCSKGFEIMDLTDFKSVTIPQRDDPRLQALAKRCEACKPMGMFRSSENEFLLCYDEFGLYVDRHGDPSRTIGTIEWEGTAERVAWHPPYVLLFDSRFIEVRHVETGRLAQIIPGNDVRCLWDGRGSSIPPISTPGPEGWQDATSQEARVHAVMKASEPAGSAQRTSRAVAQHVFQLVPTIPLYLPGSLSSPSNSTYFPHQSSPPHSPHLTARNSWR